MSLRQTASRYVVGGLALAALLALIVWATAPAAAQSSSYAASLSGGAEVPPVAMPAGGSFSASYDGSVITFTLTSDAAEIGQAHIHLGAADESGSVAAFLFGPADPPVDGVDVSGMIGAADVLQGDLDSLVAALDAGLAYVNVHTVMYGAGEVRGQIGPTAATQTNPGAVVEAYVAAINADDAAGVAALFATGRGDSGAAK